MALPVWAGSEVSSPGGAGLGGAAGPLSQPSGPLFQACHPGPCPPHSPQLGQARGVSRRGAGSGSCSRQPDRRQLGLGAARERGRAPRHRQKPKGVSEVELPGSRLGSGQQARKRAPAYKKEGQKKLLAWRGPALGRHTSAIDTWNLPDGRGPAHRPPARPSLGPASTSLRAKGRVPGWSGWRRVSCGDARRWSLQTANHSLERASLPGPRTRLREIRPQTRQPPSMQKSPELHSAPCVGCGGFSPHCPRLRPPQEPAWSRRRGVLHSAKPLFLAHV
ncbi:uncharacterized protein LOC119522931 isoform X1 [Choloepus didactylus]|uniref:uncharacterized protein LOC119522931 isoform X1 n=1 Tax=Choloepus didactylus TaxID=27675 RepID=UPI00189DBBCD|nr:uncharacterized protein LOC119522931 isoform X1 [Choloepus didactylus]XP_037677568.1 uncharacterized protein LOC119522931 isoform X1 [Choloepus didactylus]XP_037677569.1 uncharacterized protein LOC119522931 isoform X1 [Choloepus didactylus]XP_037677570.1 uncharacterized protein LOC119522931 isoform X1 [Choloepus didactylus]XP_037677572.1 uncharacterized protein LOC119522931 isoform X1 [Choloepus didactylus]XP_037677573.1 uncharacterized protein LOC119522931 isoform X1 [Choloepus didactylus]